MWGRKLQVHHTISRDWTDRLRIGESAVVKSTMACMVLEIMIHDIGKREHQGGRNFNMKSKSKGTKIAINKRTW